MKDLLLCSSNPLLVKNLYGALRELGFKVDMVEHPSHAVRAVLGKRYDVAVMDADPFGLPAEDAERVLRAIAPDLAVIVIGERASDGELAALDLERFTRDLHALAV